jgi:hypothetical protein
MAIKYSFSQEDDLLIVRTRGFDESLAEVRDYNRAVKKEAERLGCTKILADERELEYRLSVIETYQLAEDLADLVDAFQKIALVTHTNNREAADFWENVAANRGARVKVFYTIDLARSWLTEE